MGYLALRVYQDHAPVPGAVASEQGKTLFTRDDILEGQQLFLTYGLMEYGSVYGHGAYLGPRLHGRLLASASSRDAERIYGGGPIAEARTQSELQTNRYSAD